jgi:hypothetical protein
MHGSSTAPIAYICIYIHTHTRKMIKLQFLHNYSTIPKHMGEIHMYFDCGIVMQYELYVHQSIPYTLNTRQIIPY